MNRLRAGAYDFFLDETHQEHKTSPVALGVILDSLPPTFDPIPDQTIDSNSGRHVVQLAGIQPATFSRTNELVLSATCDNPALVSNIAIDYTFPNSAGSLSFATVDNAFGTATITVTLSDGQSARSLTTTAFEVSVVTPDAAPLTIQSVQFVAMQSPLDPANSQFQFQIAGPDGSVVVVEASTDPGHWTPISTNTLVNGVAVIRDAESRNFNIRLYRVRLATQAP